ncbi:MAG: hypothetical protein ACKVG9_08570 [Rhodospirillales bacterium]
MRYGLIYSTNGSISEIEEWLEEFCVGKFQVSLEDMDADLSTKSVRVLFENESDEINFKA